MYALPRLGGGRIYMTEGGVETEIMYRHGFELPEFAMFPLLDNPDAVSAMQAMFRAQLDVVARLGQGLLLSGIDYRASPDWGAKLGYSAAALADANRAAIGFLETLAAEYRGQIDPIRISGIIGPRGDAYSLNRTITAEEAEDYHAVQLQTLKTTGADFASAMTFNNVAEAVGVARAAEKVGMPLAIYFTTDGGGRLKSGACVAEAIAAVEVETGGSPEFYGLNCSHPVEFMPALDGGDWMQRLRALRPNASKMEKIALCKLGHLEEGDAPELARLMGDLAREFPQVDVWGGCCGCGARHLDLIGEAVMEARRPALV